MPYTRSHSFTDDQAANPNQALPGDQVDAELDAVSTETGLLKTQIDDVRRGDGALVNGIVTEDALEAGLRDTLVGDVEGQVQPLVDQAAASAVSAASSATLAESRRLAAASSAVSASGSAVDAGSFVAASESARDAAIVAQDGAEAAETGAVNSANAAAGHAAEASLSEETAAQWAEYLAGPVAVQEIPPDGLPPEAVESGYFSARWWANRAEQIVDLTAAWYLGPFDDYPTEVVLGSPVLEGMYFWHTVDDQFYVYDGSTWVDWSLSTGISTAVLISDATSDLEADYAAGFNEYADRTVFTRAGSDLLFWTWPSTGGNTYLYSGVQTAGPWTTVAGDWALFSADAFAPLTHFRDNGTVAEILDNGVVALTVGPTIDVAGSRRLTGLGDPTGAQDAATRAWVLAQDFGATSGAVIANTAAIGVLEGEQVTQDGRLDALEALTGDAVQGNVALDGRIAALGTVVTGLDNELGVQQTLLSSVSATVNNPTTGVTATASGLSALTGRVTTAEGDIVAQAGLIVTLQADVADAVSDASGAVSAVSALDARVTSSEGDITANASDITTLTGRVTTAEGDITSQGSAISTLETTVSGLVSESARVDALESTVNNGSTGVVATANAVSALTTRVDATEGSIVAQASDITTLQSTVGTNTSNISSQLSTINGIQAKYAVKIDVNGYVSGFGLVSTANNAAPTSEFSVLADAFNIAHPTVDGGTPQNIFSVSGGVLRVQNVEVASSLIAGEISTDLLNIDGLTLTNVGGELTVTNVDTGEIAPNAVTTQGAASQVGSIVPSALPSYLNVVSTTIDVIAGVPVSIWCGLEARHLSGAFTYLWQRITVDGVGTIYQSTGGAQTNATTVAGVYVYPATTWTPGASGTVTVRLQVSASTGVAGLRVYNGQINCTQAKR